MNNKLLPLGSVIRLKNGTKRIMICGRMVLRDFDQKMFDYCACYYPEGILDPKNLFLFQHNDIEKVYFTGYCDEEEIRLMEYINKRLMQLKK